MAAAALSVGELHELVAALADALAGVVGEMEGDTITPEDHELHERLIEHAALLATFKRLPEGELRAKLRSIFKEEQEKVSDVDAPEPWTPDVAGAEDALARLYSALLFDRELYGVCKRDAPSLAWT